MPTSLYATRFNGALWSTEAAMRAIEHWTVLAGDRLVGSLRSLDGRSESRVVVTSRVTCVLMKGDPPCPIAVTSTGSEFWLAQPARARQEASQQFVARKVREAPVG